MTNDGYIFFTIRAVCNRAKVSIFVLQMLPRVKIDFYPFIPDKKRLEDSRNDEDVGHGVVCSVLGIEL